jgi:hypothetical protein
MHNNIFRYMGSTQAIVIGPCTRYMMIPIGNLMRAVNSSEPTPIMDNNLAAGAFTNPPTLNTAKGGTTAHINLSSNIIRRQKRSIIPIIRSNRNREASFVLDGDRATASERR